MVEQIEHLTNLPDLILGNPWFFVGLGCHLHRRSVHIRYSDLFKSINLHNDNIQVATLSLLKPVAALSEGSGHLTYQLLIQAYLYNFCKGIVFKSGMKDQNGGPFSLIKYEAEIQISESIEDYNKAKSNQKVLDPKPSPEDVLNSMIPPRDWTDETNKSFMQYVSHSNASRDDVMRLKERLDQALEYRQARVDGICPIREELFKQAFDQIIRQVTISCPERGLLLMRVRDEHIMSLAAYQTLYQSSVSYGLKKQLQSEQGMEELMKQVSEDEKKVKDLDNYRIELLSKKASLDKRIMERKNIEIQKQEEEKKLIDIQAQELKKFLDGLHNIQP